VNWHGSKPSFSKAIPEAFPHRAGASWFRSQVRPIVPRKSKGQLVEFLVAKISIMWTNGFSILIAFQLGMPNTTKVEDSLLRQKN